MLRRNTADQVIHMPALLLVADGSAVTTGATITVSKDGTSGASAGTLAHVSGGVWKYTPTATETDAAIVALILTATDAVPVVLNLVTTGADTSAVALGAVTSIPSVTLATTQPSITWQPQTITAGDGNPNITLAGSGNADGIAWTRSGSGDPLDADIVDQIQSGLATSAELPTDFDTLVITAGDIAGTVGGIAGTITTLDALDTAQDTQHGTTQDRLGYTLAALAGACADAGTATETYAITIGVDTYTIDHTGLDATGNRSTATLTKS